MVGREFQMQPEDYELTIVEISAYPPDHADQLQLLGWHACDAPPHVPVAHGIPGHCQCEIEVAPYLVQLTHRDLIEQAERRAVPRAITIQ